jgi:hypothetical protein
MDTLKGVISDIRIFLYGGMITLPLTIAGTFTLIGLFTANFAMLFLMLGYLIGVPIIVWLLNIIGDQLGFENPSGKVPDICGLVMPYSTNMSDAIRQINKSYSPMFASNWTAMVFFFIGYIFTNAIQLYTRESTQITMSVNNLPSSEQGTPDLTSKVSNRKTQSLIAMISIVVFSLICIFYRLSTQCDTRWSMLFFTIPVFSALGYGWYRLMSACGKDMLSDLFGIANRLLSPTAIQNKPIACVPIPA